MTAMASLILQPSSPSLIPHPSSLILIPHPSSLIPSSFIPHPFILHPSSLHPSSLIPSSFIPHPFILHPSSFIMAAMITAQSSGRVTTITLNRPEKLLAALETAESDQACRVVVITGAGRAFSAGGDVELLSRLQKERNMDVL